MSIYNLCVCYVCVCYQTDTYHIRTRTKICDRTYLSCQVKVFQLFVKHQPIRQTGLILNIIWSLYSSLSFPFLSFNTSFALFYHKPTSLNHFQWWHVFPSTFVSLNFIMKRENIQSRIYNISNVNESTCPCSSFYIVCCNFAYKLNK